MSAHKKISGLAVLIIGSLVLGYVLPGLFPLSASERDSAVLLFVLFVFFGIPILAILFPVGAVVGYIATRPTISIFKKVLVVLVLVVPMIMIFSFLNSPGNFTNLIVWVAGFFRVLSGV